MSMHIMHYSIIYRNKFHANTINQRMSFTTSLEKMWHFVVTKQSSFLTKIEHQPNQP